MDKKEEIIQKLKEVLKDVECPNCPLNEVCEGVCAELGLD